MKNINISLVLQIVGLLFLIIIGYLVFNSSSNMNIIALELGKAKEELEISKNTITAAKTELEKSKKEFEQMKAQKEHIIHKRDSLILVFKRKNAKNWTDLQDIKDSIQLTNSRLTNDRFVLDGLFGLDK